MSISITFLGAAGTVTGSKYLVEGGGKKILIDAGMFQGSRKWRERNWQRPPVDLAEIDACLLTHAHIDHTGILPRYHKLGLTCPVYATSATTSLCHLLLPDSARIHEEGARHRAKYKKSRHIPPLPLYTEKEAKAVLQQFKNAPFNRPIEISEGVTAEWRRMGHILGAASIRLKIGDKSILFSGDIGRYDIPILKDPQPQQLDDLMLIESTYGDRIHQQHSPKEALGKIIKDTFTRSGVVLIPSFAVGRTQLILYYLRELKSEGIIPTSLPIIIDSPMARDATTIYRKHPADYDEEALGILKQGNQPFSMPKLHFINNRFESKKLNSIDEPMVLISASGMLSGGRILHHLKHRVANPKTTVLFVGYQPPGGRGHWLKSNPKSMKILGDQVPVNARVEEISGLSAHGDREEMIRWCKESIALSKGTSPSEQKSPKVMVVHGEPDSAQSFSQTLSKTFGWDTEVAGYMKTVEID